jgi:anaerobic ribonucleoside-triphosphate reductase activating protein
MVDHINVLDICDTGTRELGPGNRFVIWVQGCPFNCRNCVTPDGIPFVKNKIMEVGQLATDICGNYRIAGITISGGEPFMQASKLVKLLAMVRSIRPELNVIIFSGFTLKELNWEEAVALLSFTDVLIDGKYVEKLNDNKGLRGSSNQRIHYLTDRLKGESHYFEERDRSIEIHIYNDYQLMIGVPNQHITI